MPSLRLYPLLVAGAACLTLAACGGDDDPPEASAPVQTESATSTSKSEKAPSSPFDDYAKGGVPATKAETSAVRASLIGFQEAVGRKDTVGVCRLTVGLPATSDPKTPMSCTSLTQDGAAEPPSDDARKAIAAAKVVVANDRATAERVPGFKMPLRKIDGLWRLDYRAINNPPTSSR